MQYVELKEALKDFTIFSLNDIKRIDRSFFRTRLNEWQSILQRLSSQRF